MVLPGLVCNHMMGILQDTRRRSPIDHLFSTKAPHLEMGEEETFY